MKLSAKLAAGALGAALIISATGVASPATTDKDVREEMRDLSGFTGVQLQGSMDVFITAGKEFSVKVVTEDRLMEKIITEVEDGTLIIRMKREKKKWSWNSGNFNTRMDIYVTAPLIDTAMLAGSGDMELKGLESKDLALKLKGSGDMILKGGVFTNVRLDLQGSGDMTASGSCKAIELDLRGSGDMEARKMKCEDAQAALRGSGDMTLYASNSASMSLRGSGDIDVYGDPKRVDRNVRGSGDIALR